MTITANAKTMLAAMTRANKAKKTKNQLPILDNFLFEVDGLNCQITASDLEQVLTVEAKLEANTSEVPQTFCADASGLMELFRALGDVPVVCSIEGNKFELLTETGKYNMPLYNHEDFPKFEEIADGETIEISGNDLERILGIKYATASDEIRPVMNGICLDNEMAAASDAHKLHAKKYTRKEGSLKNPLLISKNAIDALGYFADSVAVKIEVGEKFFTVEAQGDSAKYRCRKIEGTYPAWRTVVPKINDARTTVTVKIKDFMSVLRRVSVLTNPASGLVKLSIHADGLEVSGKDIDFSTSASESLEAKVEMPKDLATEVIALKTEFLQQILGSLKAENATLHITSGSTAMLITTALADGEIMEDGTALLMPMMIND